MFADADRPGKIHKPDQRMSDQAVANFGRITGDNINHTGREHLGNFLKCQARRKNGQF